MENTTQTSKASGSVVILYNEKINCYALFALDFPSAITTNPDKVKDWYVEFYKEEFYTCDSVNITNEIVDNPYGLPRTVKRKVCQNKKVIEFDISDVSILGLIRFDFSITPYQKIRYKITDCINKYANGHRYKNGNNERIFNHLYKGKVYIDDLIEELKELAHVNK